MFGLNPHLINVFRVGRKACCIVTYIGCLGCMFGVSYSNTVALYIGFRVGVAAFAYGSTIGSFVYREYVTSLYWVAVSALVICSIIV